MEQVQPIFKEWYDVFTLLFMPDNWTLIILLFLTLLLFGPTLKKIYGPVKFILIYVLVGLIGGNYFHFLLYELVKTTSIISMGGLLGVYFPLILKRHHMITTTNKVLFWLYFLINILLFRRPTKEHYNNR